MLFERVQQKISKKNSWKKSRGCSCKLRGVVVLSLKNIQSQLGYWGRNDWGIPPSCSRVHGGGYFNLGRRGGGGPLNVEIPKNQIPNTFSQSLSQFIHTLIQLILDKTTSLRFRFQRACARQRLARSSDMATPVGDVAGDAKLTRAPTGAAISEERASRCVAHSLEPKP